MFILIGASVSKYLAKIEDLRKSEFSHLYLLTYYAGVEPEDGPSIQNGDSKWEGLEVAVT